MLYYSTNHKSSPATLATAVTRGLAPDRGLYMPEHIRQMPATFFDKIQDMTFKEIARNVARAFFDEDIDGAEIDSIVDDTLAFDCPVVHVGGAVYALELFHGPTLAFKDVGARFMARLLSHFIKQEHTGENNTVNVLVATSGDTGSAVANGFLGVEGIRVYVLYPKGKVSPIQESQFTTLGQNVTALEIDGTFDDCQALVKEAFADMRLNETMRLTSANSINVARLLPQAFYYFNAYARMKANGVDKDLVFCVPSGNFGNLTAGLTAQAMGLPVKRFIAANNANDVFLEYLETGKYNPRPSIATIANAMDVGAPSNFARILELYNNSYEEICRHVSGASYTDDEITAAITKCYNETGYVLDPHGACGYMALKDNLQEGETGIFLETAHPAKFIDTVEKAIGCSLPIPARLAAFMKGEKKSVQLSNNYSDFRHFLNSVAENS